MNPIRFALLSALLSPLVEEDETTEQEPDATNETSGSVNDIECEPEC